MFFGLPFEVFATPFFLIFIIVELFIAKAKGKKVYRLNDSMSNISAGLLMSVTNVLVASIYFTIYFICYDHYRLFNLPENSLWVWFLAWLYYDFIAYVLHYLQHKINWLWAGHVVHHQSEEYNYSVALRHTSTGGYYVWFAFVPMAILGVNPEVIVSTQAIHMAWQFYIHTRVVNRMGVIEKWLQTPSHHRVHHGKNPQYIDKNFGSMLLVWDKLFGTFKSEDDFEEVRYGVVNGMQSFSPFWANVNHYVSMFRNIASRPSLRNIGKQLVVVAGEDSVAKHGYSEVYNPAASKLHVSYAFVQFVCAIVLVLSYITLSSEMTAVYKIFCAAYLWSSLVFVCNIIEGDDSYIAFDFAKNVLAIVAIFWIGVDVIRGHAFGWLLIGYLCTSAFCQVVILVLFKKGMPHLRRVNRLRSSTV